MDFLDFLCQKEERKREEWEREEGEGKKKKKTKHENFYPYNAYKVKNRYNLLWINLIYENGELHIKDHLE